MATNLDVWVNSDTQDQALNTSGVTWTEMDVANDKLIFSAGSDDVKDGEAIPSDTELNQALTVIDDISDVEVDKCFLQDTGSAILREIFNYAGNKQYVYALDFDGATASEPVLEVWDDENLNTRDLNSLGAGIATNSWLYGVVTNTGLPGASWTGTQLAGNASNHFLELNDGSGALSGADTLYFNLKIIIPAGLTVSGLEAPVITVKFTTN